MDGHFPQGGFAVGQKGSHVIHVDDGAVEHPAAVGKLFKNIFVHLCSSPVDNLMLYFSYSREVPGNPADSL